MTKYSKYFIAFVFAVLLIAPAIQTFKILPLAPLNGAFTLVKVPEFSMHAWFSGEFQEQCDKSIEDHIGFRSFFVRLKNEIDFDLFGITHASNVIVGKEKVLYQDFYLQALNGEDFVGDAVVRLKLDKFQFVQDELAKRGIFLMLMIAPGKASIYPEYLPENFTLNREAKTNYGAYINELHKRQINYIDMRQYFMQIKDTVTFPLFPKCGTHWSGYAVTLVADTLFRYIENKTHTNLTSYHRKKGVVTDSDFRFTDNDIGSGLNLLFDISSWDVYYPNVVFDKESDNVKPNILSIGDSFNQSFWGFYPFFDTIFGPNSQYWYYNKIISWPDSLEKKYIPTEHLDYKKEIEKRQVVLIVTTEQNLKDFGFSFIDEAYNVYLPSVEYEKQIADYVAKAQTDSIIHNMILQKANEKQLSFDVMAFMDAKWLVNEAGRQRDAEILKSHK